MASAKSPFLAYGSPGYDYHDAQGTHCLYSTGIDWDSRPGAGGQGCRQ